jgi:hypothetical protein
MKPPLGEPGAARITHPAHAAPTQKARVNTSGPRIGVAWLVPRRLTGV